MFIIEKEELPSTQEYCINNYKKMEMPCAVVARSQTSGKGRGKSTWVSSDGSLTFSVVILLSRNIPSIPIIVSNIIRRILSRNHRIENILVKWPNDLFMRRDQEEHKVGGVISNVIERERANNTEENEYVCIVGIGIDVTRTSSMLMNRYLSIEDISGIRIKKTDLLREIAEEIERVFTKEEEKEYFNWAEYFPYKYVMYKGAPYDIVRIEDDLYIEDSNKKTVRIGVNEHSYIRHSNTIVKKV